MVRVYRAAPVEAIQFDGKNWLEICQWANPAFEWRGDMEEYKPEEYPIAPGKLDGEFMSDGPISLSVITRDGDEWFAERGEWVVRRVVDGSWTVLSDKEFKQTYENEPSREQLLGYLRNIQRMAEDE